MLTAPDRGISELHHWFPLYSWRSLLFIKGGRLPCVCSYSSLERGGLSETELHLLIPNSVPSLRFLSNMGNGSVKPKHAKHAEGQSGNLSTDALRSKVAELERELRRKDAELQDREYHLKELREQLAKQTVAIAELTEELTSKCIQLNKLLDVIHVQGGSPPQTSPDKVPLEVHRKTSGLVSLHSRRGAKAGVSAEPTTRTYDLNKPPEFSFEKARVRKDSR